MGFAEEFVADLKACGAPEEPDPAVLGDLLERWKYYFVPSGPGYPRDEIKDAIILQLAIPVFKITLRYRTRNNADDILSEAMLALVECVGRWREVAEDDNIRRYVEASVKKRIKEFVDNDGVLVIPSRRVQEKAKKGEQVEQPSGWRLDFQENEDEDAPSCQPDESYDLMDFFRSRLSERDVRVAELKLEGYSVKNIAIELKVGKSTVYYSIQNMEAAYLEWEQAHQGELCTAC